MPFFKELFNCYLISQLKRPISKHVSTQDAQTTRDFPLLMILLVQALLLMTQAVQGTRRSSQTWYLQRLTVQAAFQIGIHAPTQPGEFTPLVWELRKRAWFMCFLLDK